MEQMDNIFGGSSARENLQLMADCRNELGLTGDEKVLDGMKFECPDAGHVEIVSRE
jgi:hypothetical protein